MAENENEEQSLTDKQREANLNTDYYDEVDEEAYNVRNVSEPDARSRDLWQSTTISTDDTGPRVEDVAPVFAQFRADALANPNFPDGEDSVSDQDKADTARAAEEAQAEADRLRESGGFVASTGADAGVYDDPKLEDQVPGDNFSAKPEVDEDAGERDSDQVAAEEKAETAGAGTVHTDEVDQQPPQYAGDHSDADGEQNSNVDEGANPDDQASAPKATAKRKK